MHHLLKLIFTLTITLFGLQVNGAESIIEDHQGVAFYQVDYPENNPPAMDTAIGMMNVNLLLLRNATGIESGYLNMVMGGEWLVRNMVIPTENEFPYDYMFTDFDLGNMEGNDIAEINAGVQFSEQVYTDAPVINDSIFPVGAQERVEGGGYIDAGDPGDDSNAEVPTQPPTVKNVLFGENPANTRRVLQLDHPNLEAARNQCVSMAVANSLQFLANTTDLELPHSHVQGLRGDNSLVGQLDRYMNRTVTNRRVGGAVDPYNGVVGKLKYLAANGLGDRVQTRHWGWQRKNGKVFGESTYTISNAQKVKLASSTHQGKTFDVENDIMPALQRGENCEAIITWPKRNGQQGFDAHAVDIVAAGITNNIPWFAHRSDINQRTDDPTDKGTRTIQFELARDTDGDGYYNTKPNKNLGHLICQKYIPPTKETSSLLLPDPETEYAINDAAVEITDTIDAGGHGQYADKPPKKARLKILNRKMVIEAITTQIEAGSDDDFEVSTTTSSAEVSWLPFDDISVGDDGSLGGENETEVAGFNSVENTITGQIAETALNTTVTLGAGGELPGGDALIYHLDFLPEGPWPWTIVPEAPQLKPAIRVNGARGEHTMTAGEPVSVGLSLTQGDQSGPRDWWIAAQSEDLLLTFDLESGNWTGEIKPTYSGDLFDLPQTTFFQSLEGLPAGDYTFYAGVDPMNGQLDLESIVYDAINLTVEEETQQGL